jgi:hypothetical protein
MKVSFLIGELAMMTKNIHLHTDLCLDLICDQNDVNMRYNMQFFIQNL